MDIALILAPPTPAHIAVAGTDGTGVNARSWARTAKAGMKRAAAPQERARPRSFQQILTINRAKGKFIRWQLNPCVCVHVGVRWVFCFMVVHMKNSTRSSLVEHINFAELAKLKAFIQYIRLEVVCVGF